MQIHYFQTSVYLTGSVVRPTFPFPFLLFLGLALKFAVLILHLWPLSCKGISRKTCQKLKDVSLGIQCGKEVFLDQFLFLGNRAQFIETEYEL